MVIKEMEKILHKKYDSVRKKFVEIEEKSKKRRSWAKKIKEMTTPKK